MGRHERQWLDSNYVLRHFSTRTTMARRFYRSFVESGIPEGRRKDLTGGGFVRSNRGWRPGRDRLKSDERILGSSDFVLETLRASREAWERSHALKASGVDFIAVRDHAARLFGLDPEDILLPGKYPSRVAARSVLCWFCVRGLGMTCTAVAEKLMIGQPAVSIAVARGEKIAKEKGFGLPEGRN